MFASRELLEQWWLYPLLVKQNGSDFDFSPLICSRNGRTDSEPLLHSSREMLISLKREASEQQDFEYLTEDNSKEIFCQVLGAYGDAFKDRVLTPELAFFQQCAAVEEIGCLFEIVGLDIDVFDLKAQTPPKVATCENAYALAPFLFMQLPLAGFIYKEFVTLSSGFVDIIELTLSPLFEMLPDETRYYCNGLGVLDIISKRFDIHLSNVQAENFIFFLQITCHIMIQTSTGEQTAYRPSKLRKGSPLERFLSLSEAITCRKVGAFDEKLTLLAFLFWREIWRVIKFNRDSLTEDMKIQLIQFLCCDSEIHDSEKELFAQLKAEAESGNQTLLEEFDKWSKVQFLV
jgi:hypothetical protein